MTAEHLPETPPQIDAWKAIEFALDHIDDHYDRSDFLRDCSESGMPTIGVDWPEFAAWMKA